jgi:hypothetical protein
VFSNRMNRQRTRSMFKANLKDVVQAVYAVWREIVDEVGEEQGYAKEGLSASRTDYVRHQRSADSLTRLRNIIHPTTGTYVPGTGFVESPKVSRNVRRDEAPRQGQAPMSPTRRRTALPMVSRPKQSLPALPQGNQTRSPTADSKLEQRNPLAVSPLSHRRTPSEDHATASSLPP